MRFREAIVAGAVLSSSTLFGAPCAIGQTMDLETVASGLTRPVFVTAAPGDPYRLYILEKPGRIQILDLTNPGAGLTQFIDFSSLVSTESIFSEQGALGLAFHPDYESNGLFYVHYTSIGGMGNPPAGDSVIGSGSRLTPDSAQLNTNQIMLVIDQPAPNHNGGWMGFSPVDGFLYLAIGDGGGSNDEFENSQDINTLMGAMLRIDVDGTDGSTGFYGIPASNPFANEPGADEIWAFGLRNPWRCSFDRQTGDLFIGDVGQATWEEINFQPAGSIGEENYGWPCFEGPGPFQVIEECDPAPIGTIFPIDSVGNSTSPFACAITGGVMYRGAAIPAIQGNYFFADYCADRVWTLAELGGGSFGPRTEVTGDLEDGGVIVDRTVSFGEDAFAEVYLVNINGFVHRVVPEGGFDDCNANKIPDASEIAEGFAADVNNNGIPDECGPCPGDANADRFVNFGDVTAVLANWLTDYTMTPEMTGPGDSDGSGIVDFSDVTESLANWLADCP